MDGTSNISGLARPEFYRFHQGEKTLPFTDAEYEARLKGLREGWADPFGYTAERRAERRFRDLYLGWLAQAGPDADPELLRLPTEVRGYGPVKEPALATAIERLAGAR